MNGSYLTDFRWSQSLVPEPVSSDQHPIPSFEHFDGFLKVDLGYLLGLSVDFLACGSGHLY